MTVVDALAREVGSVGVLLHKLRAGDWTRPTRCPPMTVKDLVAHMARGAARIREMLAVEPTDVQPEKDAVTYFQYDAVAEAPVILARAQEAAADVTVSQLRERWDQDWIHALAGVRWTLAGADPVLPTVFGLMRLSEYVRTRNVEVTIHHMDLDDAFGKDPHPDPAAIEAVGDVLRGLLGTDLRPMGMDDVRFALTGTGRAALTQEERAYLGPLAAKFPLFA